MVVLGVGRHLAGGPGGGFAVGDLGVKGGGVETFVYSHQSVGPRDEDILFIQIKNF